MAWRLLGRIRQPRSKAVTPTRIGFLPLGSPSNSYDQSLVEAFRKGLRDVGLVENRDVVIEVVWVGNKPEFPSAVSNLIQRGATLLVTAGLVDTLARPGGNATGF